MKSINEHKFRCQLDKDYAIMNVERAGIDTRTRIYFYEGRAHITACDAFAEELLDDPNFLASYIGVEKDMVVMVCGSIEADKFYVSGEALCLRYPARDAPFGSEPKISD